MLEKTPSQMSFEVETADWGLDYERNESGKYSSYETGICFGAFDLGWDSALKYTESLK